MRWPDSPASGGSLSRSGSASPVRTAWQGAAFTPSPGGSAGDNNDGGSSCYSPATAADATPLVHPEAALQEALAALQQAAASQKRELDWQAQFEALRTGRRLARHHPAVLAPALRSFVALAAPVIDSLRSTVARLAIAVFQVCSGVRCALPPW